MRSYGGQVSKDCCCAGHRCCRPALHYVMRNNNKRESYKQHYDQRIAPYLSTKRTAIDPREKLKLDDLLLIQLQQFYFQMCGYCLPTGQWPAAVSQYAFIQCLSQAQHSHAEHRIPRANFDSRDIQAILIKEDSVYKTSDYGITEPSAGEVVDPAAIDLVFVPLLICDKGETGLATARAFTINFLCIVGKM